MQDFDFAQILGKFTQILPEFAQFTHICPNLIQICPTFTQIYQSLLRDAAASLAPTALTIPVFKY